MARGDGRKGAAAPGDDREWKPVPEAFRAGSAARALMTPENVETIAAMREAGAKAHAAALARQRAATLAYRKRLLREAKGIIEGVRSRTSTRVAEIPSERLAAELRVARFLAGEPDGGA